MDQTNYIWANQMMPSRLFSLSRAYCKTADGGSSRYATQPIIKLAYKYFLRNQQKHGPKKFLPQN